MVSLTALSLSEVVDRTQTGDGGYECNKLLMQVQTEHRSDQRDHESMIVKLKMKPIYVWVLPLVGGLFAGIFVYWLLGSPMPTATGIETDDIFKSLISWGLSRQTAHAALGLSAVVGLFSLLRLRPETLARSETRIFFFGFLVFLSYEYFKLIRSFQLVNQWERMLSESFPESLFLLDPLQDRFFATTNSIVQALLISVAVVLLIRIYAHASKRTD
jgi:hypothetical protein